MGKLCTTGREKQAVYDAIKKAREDGESWVTFKDKRIKIVDPDKFPENGYGPSGCGLVNFKGRIRLTGVWSKDSYTWCYPTKGSYGVKIRLDQIVGCVVEVYDRKTGREIPVYSVETDVL